MIEFLCPKCGSRNAPAIGDISDSGAVTSDGEYVVINTRVNVSCQKCFKLDHLYAFVFHGYPHTLTRVCLDAAGKEVVANGYSFNYEKKLGDKLEMIVKDGVVKDKILSELVEYYSIDVKDGDTLILVSDDVRGIIPDGYL